MIDGRLHETLFAFDAGDLVRYFDVYPAPGRWVTGTVTRRCTTIDVRPDPLRALLAPGGRPTWTPAYVIEVGPHPGGHIVEQWRGMERAEVPPPCPSPLAAPVATTPEPR